MQATCNEGDIFKLQATGSMGGHLPEKIPRIVVRVAAQQWVSTKFLKLKQSITRKKMNRKSKKGRT